MAGTSKVQGGKGKTVHIRGRGAGAASPVCARASQPWWNDTLSQTVLYCGNLCLTGSSALACVQWMLVASPCHGTPNIFLFLILPLLRAADLLCLGNSRDIFEIGGCCVFLRHLILGRGRCGSCLAVREIWGDHVGNRCDTSADFENTE